MKAIFLFLFIFMVSYSFGQHGVSQKNFEPISLVNKIEFYEAKFNQPKFSCAFLLTYQNDTFAITAKHLLKIIKTDKMNAVSLANEVKNWSFYPLNHTNETIVADKLLNENKAELLESKSTFEKDWLVFSIKENHTNIKPLQLRTSPLTMGEKLYVVGWTRKMEEGEQRVYEFEYHKTIENRILLKEVIVPEKFGGLSGAPLVDEKGLVVGIVSNATIDPESNEKYFSPCTLTGVISVIEQFQKHD
ncbi:trypsin-like serine protease [Arcicella sp. LKC2W]|uniref:trypsin-like serine protease n=1 Tax=Arcicella sp. LKC2W TaxID=2984198 RepID=UPI002B1F7DA6|nr:trypsin-like serine protease [Arcicella sp. LKC2W]MEA5461047.1 trypsin-like serine protease [Arcicella sp. LKC2W]